MLSGKHFVGHESLQLGNHAILTLPSLVVAPKATNKAGCVATRDCRHTHILEICFCHIEHIHCIIHLLVVRLHREEVLGFTYLASFGINALLFVVDGRSVNYEHATLLVVMLIRLSNLEFFEHES